MILREILHAHIPYLTPESTVRDAVDKMDVYQFPALVIVDKLMAPLAVITEGDICRAAREHDGVIQLSSKPALDFATRDPKVARPDTEVSDALQTMQMSGLTLLPVVEEERLRGVVLRVDLMHAMLLDTAPTE
jgi:CBS domain-containing protein